MTVRLRKVGGLFRRARAGDKAAIDDLEYLVATLMRSARDVVDNWEHGDLAAAVNEMRGYLDHAEGRRHGL